MLQIISAFLSGKSDNKIMCRKDLYPVDIADFFIRFINSHKLEKINSKLLSEMWLSNFKWMKNVLTTHCVQTKVSIVWAE